MTAEIAIINRSAIAVAADSAATIGRKKVWKSANKLFSLGPCHDIGVMFYGSADLFGCHWEIIIKSFRETINDRNFKTIPEAVEAFTQFIKLPKWVDERAMQIASAHMIALCIETIKEDVEFTTVMEFRSSVRQSCEELSEEILEHDIVLNITKKSFSSAYRDLIKQFFEEIFEQKAVKTVLDPVENYIFEFARRAECTTGFETGMVIFGYGEDDIYPSLEEVVIDAAVDNNVRIWSRRNIDLNQQSGTKGGIIPFAQTDVASLFMEGISSMYVSFFAASLEVALNNKDSSYRNWVPEQERIVEDALRSRENDAILEEFRKAFISMRQREVIGPVVESIHSLPRDEMAAMAEALVELTSMRRKVDSTLDTVGGAVDVAVISKGEGFVWIKRKTYFDAKENPDYLVRRGYRLRKGVSS